MTKESVLPDNVPDLPNADLNKEKKEIGSVNPNIQNALIQEVPNMRFSDSENQVEVRNQTEKEEQVEIASNIESCKTDLAESVSPSICYSENNQENRDLSNIEPLQIEKSSGEIVEERVTVKKKTFGKQKSKTTLEKFPKNELSNFVGDWPVDKSMGQRIRKNRKAEKAPSAQNDKKLNQPSHKVLDNSQSVNLDHNQQQESPQESVEEVKCDVASEVFSSCQFDTYKNTEKTSFNIGGDWPSFDSLEQRQHRSRKSKMSLNESTIEFRAKDSVNEQSLYPAHESCWGTSPEELKIMGSSELLSSEMTHDNKNFLSETIQGQHSPLPTFTTSSPSIHGVVRPQSSGEFSEVKPKELLGVGVDMPTQTEPQDFALLWKIEKNKISITDSVRVLTGRLDGFQPKAFNINTTLDVQETIPYRVMHDKSTYVEENELTSADESENLNILCKLFGSFSLEALKDLYERCNKDIIWATSLLLDSETKLCEDTEFENNENTYDEGKIGPFSVGLNLKEIISQRGSFEDSNVSVSGHSQRIGIRDSTVQSICDSEEGNSEQAETGVTTTDRPALMSIFPNGTVDQKNTKEALADNHVELSGLYNVEQSFPGALKATAAKDTNEKETLEAREIGDSRLALNLSDNLNSVSNILNPELNDTAHYTDSFEMRKNEKLLKDTVKFPNTEDFMNEDEQEMEKILIAGNTSLIGAGEEGKTEMLNPTPVMTKSLTIDCLELALPPELAFQLNELFGPVGIESGKEKLIISCVSLLYIHINLGNIDLGSYLSF